MREKWQRLPPLEQKNGEILKDWMIYPCQKEVQVNQGKTELEIILSNGLITRTFKLTPNGATIGYDNLITGEAIIRGVKPEAMLCIDGKVYNIGGLVGQEEYAYFRPEWIEALKGDPAAFQLKDFEVSPIRERFPWKKKRHCENHPWPPDGISLHFRYINSKLPQVEVYVHYEMYKGLPLLSKSITVRNSGKEAIRLNSFSSEILAMVEYESVVESRPHEWGASSIHVESDYAFYGFSNQSAIQTTHWVSDPQYTSQVTYLSNAPLMLESKPPIGPELDIAPGTTFESFRTYELIFDSTDRERRSLIMRRMYRTIAPWVTENPIFMHIVTADPAKVKIAIDQCVEVGFEMVIISFGSGLNMEWDDPEFFEEYHELFDYAHAKGIEIGTYSLFSSRSIGEKDDVIDPETGKPSTRTAFTHAPCLASEWGINYLETLKKFITKTGADFLEHDGPYPGDKCASTKHPGHKGFLDSQWIQWKMQADFYRWCRANGIYVNAPDWYFLSGSTKHGMGYKEVNWSLPRERQVIIARQNIYDGTWDKTPSMGWMFTPLTVYHPIGGWQKSTLEPLKDYLPFYEAHLQQNFGSGVQSCYRGNRLFDSDETKAVVKKWVDFFKKYRAILESDIIHVRRPDGRHLDCILHVNPQIRPQGLAMVYNPLRERVRTNLKLPLYYTGIADRAWISEQEKDPVSYTLDRQYCVNITVDLPPESASWFVIEGENA